jgi:hypothetical protein
MVYRGVAKGKIIELEGDASLPEGTPVEVSIKEERIEGIAPGEYPKGSPRAVLAALKVAPRCTAEDVEALIQSMEQGKQPVRFEGVFE